MKWYSTKSAGRGQGLVIEEDTGRNVAVSYDEKDTQLLAAAPELLEACKELLRCLQQHIADESEVKNVSAKQLCPCTEFQIPQAIAAIAKAEGKV
jgi:hypothetical protein